MAAKKTAKPRKKATKRVSKVDKPYCGGTMTSSAFWSFIRSALRQKSRRWAPVYAALGAAKRPSQSDNKRLKWEFLCAECKRYFPQKLVSVDHRIPVGALRCAEDLPGFVTNLFCEVDNLQVLCQTCHDAKTQEENTGNNGRSRINNFFCSTFCFV